MPVSMTGKIAYVEVITPPAIRGPAGPRYFCLAREAIETRPIGVAPENPPTPISYRLARASRSGSYSAVTTRTGSACIPPRRGQPAPAQTARQGFKVPRTLSEPFPNATEMGRKIKFLTVDADFGPS